MELYTIQDASEISVSEITESEYYELADGSARKLCGIETTMGAFTCVEATDRDGVHSCVVTARQLGHTRYFLLPLQSFYALIKLWILAQEENFDALLTPYEKPRLNLVRCLNELVDA